jgi:hypothetical protein
VTPFEQLKQFIDEAPLPLLRRRDADGQAEAKGRGAVSVHGMVFDALARDRITSVEAVALSRAADERLDREGVQFDRPPKWRPQEPRPLLPKPDRAPLPPPLILEDRELLSCSQRRWAPDEPIRIADTAWEQLSRLENYALAIELTDLQSCDDQWNKRRKDAIWAAVCIELELTMAARGLRPRKEVAGVA